MADELKVAICDDDQELIPFIAKEIVCAGKQYQENVVVKGYFSGEKLLQAVESEKFDLVFLDIEMPEIDGFHLAKHIKTMFPEIPIIFVSFHDYLVFQSYEYEPLWFIRKGDMERDMPRVFKKYFEKMEYRRKTYQFKAGRAIKIVRLCELIFLECNRHTLTVNTVKEIFNAYGTMKREEENLDKYSFLRIHRNYLVNINFIESFEEYSVTLMNKCKLPISKDRKNYVKQKLLEEKFDSIW